MSLRGSIVKFCCRQVRERGGGEGGRDVFIKIQPCCILTSNFGEGVSGEENSHCSPYWKKLELLFQEKKLFAIQVECHNPVDPTQRVDILTVNQQKIWSSPSKQSREGGKIGFLLNWQLANSSGAQILLRMRFLWLCMCCSTDLWRASWVASAKKMNGKILILLIKLNKSSLELPFVLFISFNCAEWKACSCPYRGSWSALDAASFGEKPQEKEACDKWKGALPCPWEASFFCTDLPCGSCSSRV